ncbi:MAG: hypothetical protein ACFE91_12090 [Promethearchaeota archaeon]
MQLKNNSRPLKKTFLLIALIYSLILPITDVILINTFNSNFSNSFKLNADEDGEDSIMWKLGKGLPGTGATMKPRLVNFTGNGESLIIVGTDEGLATITLDGFITMSYRTFGPVIDFEVIEDISDDDIDDIILITYYEDHPNLIAIASNNGSEIWKFKPTIEGISTETYETQEFITYTWDLEIINDIDGDSISEVIISSWYRIIVVNGKSGNKIWMNDSNFSNDVWKLEVIEDINNNGFETIIAGSEEGKLSAFDSKSGKRLWTFKVEEMEIPIMTMFGRSKEIIPNSIDDIKVIMDVNNDEIDDLLIAADDGYLRVISGKSGLELDNQLCYNISQMTEVRYVDSFPSSPYTSIRRLFMKSGVKIYEIPDINDDGISEYMAIACDLDYQYRVFQERIIWGKIFNINPEFEIINITYSMNWSYEEFYLASYPEIFKSDSNIQIYFYLYNIEWGSINYAQINCYDINDVTSGNPILVYADPDYYTQVSLYSQMQTAHYLLNLGDLNYDGFEELFAISANGRYLCIDIKNDDILWVKTRKDFELDFTEINDLNNDGSKDLLIKQISDFKPDWIGTDYDEWQEQTREERKIISGLYTINGKTGTVIWSFNLPSPQYYEGLRDLKNVGDISDDGIDDYVGWIIPSTIPSDILEIIESLSGEETIESETYDVDIENIYRALLLKYTKFLAIDGSNGSIFWDTPLLDFSYEFYRQFKYTESYEDPIEVYNYGDNFYNRINGELPSSWGSYDNIIWDQYWEIASLLHPNDLQIIKGSSYDNKFELWGEQGTNFTITAVNSSESSKSLKKGTTTDKTSIGTVESEDSSYWVLNSISSNGDHRIEVELSFNLSQLIESELKYITVEYDGYVLNDVIEKMDIFIYNFSSGEWKKISMDSINSTDPVNLVTHINNINGFTSGLNNLVKIKLDARNSSKFTIYIDKLVVNYIYTFKNYTITAQEDGGSWKTILDLTIPTGFSDDELLGAMDYQLSQIERFSALKLQSYLTVNTSDSPWYNFTYEIYDYSNEKWVLCNWSEYTRTWNNDTYPDLQGGFGGSRIDYNDFVFDTGTYRDDRIWLITRGTDDVDPYIEFDYENKTTLSNFIDSNKNIRIRLNVTNGNFPFNLTIDHLGIGAFYWGLFSNRYDRFYIWDYEGYYQGKFTDDNLLDLEIQDFDVINGTNDSDLDLVSVIGIEGVDYGYPSGKEWSARIRLFDIKNKKCFTKWSLNVTYIPSRNVRILPINNSLNNWVLSGVFQFGSNYNCSHKLVSDPHWENQITHFDNYSDSYNTFDFVWEEIPYFPEVEYSSSIRYEFPGKTYISEGGKIGLLIGVYEYLEMEFYGDLSLSNIRIMDVSSRSTISKISTVGLHEFRNIEVGKIDFSLEGAGYKLLISYKDFNDDDFLDHVGMYRTEMINGYASSGIEFKIYSGNSGDSDAILLYRNLFENIELGYVPDETLDELKMPFTSIDDINNDEIQDALIGIQANSYSSQCKGSYLNFYDIHNSNQNELNELTEYKWVLDPIKCISRYYSPSYQFIFDAKKIGDINADNFSEVSICRNFFIETVTEYGQKLYESFPRIEILDISNQNVLYRFKINVDSIFPIDDLNVDGKKELLISSKELIYCINSKFGVHILKPKNEQSMGSYAFDIEWDTDSEFDYFEVLIDGISQGPTTAKKIHVSLGSGWRQISIIMHDKSGLIIAVSAINVLIPQNQIQLILTFVFLGVAAGLYVVYRRLSKKKGELILIDKKLKEGGKK